MSITDLAQFKFSSGHEIICEVVEWPENKGKDDIIVRNAMAIMLGETPEGDRVYMFKPWVHFFALPHELISVNSSHVISHNRPNDNLIIEYTWAVKEMHQQAMEREEDYRNDERQKIKKIQNALSAWTKPKTMQDSASSASNIVKFPGKDDTLH